MKIESKLAEVISQVYRVDNLQAAKEILIPFLEASKIKEADKKTMLAQIKKLTHLGLLQVYITNALLKYEGLGL